MCLVAQYGAPIGGGGLPLPWHHKKSQKDSTGLPTISADGRTVSNDGKKLVVATEDGRTLTLKVESKTKFAQSGKDIAAAQIVPRTQVHVEAAEDEEAYLTAVRVELVKDAGQNVGQTEAPASSGAGDQPDRPRSTVSESPVDAPDRPILRRGKPKTEESASPPRAESHNNGTDFTITEDDANSDARNRPAYDALIGRAKDWALNFTSGLPNFVCQQSTTRYMEESKSSGWQAQDVVTAKVVFEDGKESYSEITVGGKRVNKSMLELGGSTSIGEFASVLRSLFSDASQTQFTFYRSATIRDLPAAIYDFKVGLRNSDWFTQVGGQSLKPAYSGSVWVDRSTAEVRRIELEANNIPKDFPLDMVQWAIDYDKVRLGTADFLLPVHAENLACWRGSTTCVKNAIDFRDYHKFSGESTITFEK